MEDYDWELSQYWFSPENTSTLINDHITRYCYDEAYHSYTPKLKDFILSYTTGLNGYGTRLQNGFCQFQSYEHSSVDFVGHKRMFLHSELHVRYLTFDGRLGIDLLEKGSSFMINETIKSSSTPYRFGQIIEMFSVWIKRPRSAQKESIDILFVRWYETDTEMDVSFGSSSQTDPYNLPHNMNCPRSLRFVTANQEAFGFLKPSEILRKVVVVPELMGGFTSSQLSPSNGRFGNFKDVDYKHYRVECFADHDLFHRLHTKPSIYSFVRALERPLIHKAEISRVVPRFIFAQDEVPDSQPQSPNSLELKMSDASLTVDICELSDMREDEMY